MTRRVGDGLTPLILKSLKSSPNCSYQFTLSHTQISHSLDLCPLSYRCPATTDSNLINFEIAAIMWVLTTAIALFLVPTSALDASDFANNAASDLGPLITLFGENVTAQFLKSSFSVFDSILFAMAPIGIITAISSAIRVGSITLLKTLIGRAQESLEAVEIEVLSSTSDDVCEIWNGNELVRVTGNGNVLEIIYRKDSNLTPKGEQSWLFSDSKR